MLKGKVKKRKKPFLNFVEKRFTNLQPPESSVTTREAGRQALMILGQVKKKKKNALLLSMWQKGHIAKTVGTIVVDSVNTFY